MASTKICRQCKFFKPDYSWSMSAYRIAHGKCAYPAAQTVNIVSGEVSYMKAERMRENESLCGEHAKFYEYTSKYWMREIDWSFVSLVVGTFVIFILNISRIIIAGA